jgi:hypothetical protein
LKILIEVDNMGGHWPLKLGWANVLRYCGHQVYLWHTDRPHEPIFDIFNSFKPDIVYSNTYTISEDTIRVLTEFPETRVILFASANGPAAKELGPEFNIVRAQRKEIKLVEKMKKLTGRPDYVWIHHHPNKVDYTLSGWGDIGCEWRGIPNAADTFIFHGGRYDPALACDVTMVGGFWPYKGQNISKFILPLCNENINVKIFGNAGWPVPQYLGFIDDSRMKDLFASAKVCVNAHEPHSTDARNLAGNIVGADVVERPFKVLSSKGFCVSDHVRSLTEDFFTNNEIPTASTQKDYRDLVMHFVENPDERLPYIDRGYNTVMNGHTYFHRVAYMFGELGMDSDKEFTMSKYDEFKKENNVA